MPPAPADVDDHSAAFPPGRAAVLRRVPEAINAGVRGGRGAELTLLWSTHDPVALSWPDLVPYPLFERVAREIGTRRRDG